MTYCALLSIKKQQILKLNESAGETTTLGERNPLLESKPANWNNINKHENLKHSF